MDEIQEVEDLLKKIEKDKKLELHSALDLIYRCGIGKKEVCSITIGDVKKKSNSFSLDTHAKKKKRDVEIDGKAYANFNKYFNSIKQPSEINDGLPLFPKYYGASGEKLMAEHCKKYPKKITPKTVRSAGIKSYNNTLLVTQPNKNLRYKIVADKFRLSLKAVKDVIEGTIKGAGKKPLSNKQANDLAVMQLFDKLAVCDSKKSKKIT